MAFALSGTDIIQTGTDANCSGLSAIAGVVTMTQGTERTYNLGNLTLNINGTLSQDPDFEHLIFDATNTRAHDIVVSGGGTWNLGVATVVNGFTKYSQGDAVISQRNIPAAGGGTYQLLSGSSTIFVSAGATWNYRGGFIKLNHTIFITSTGKLNMFAGRVQLVGNIRRFGLFSTGAVNFYGGTLDGVQLLVQNLPATFSGVEYINNQGISIESSNNRNLTNIFKGLAFNGSAIDCYVWFGALLELRNSAKGSAIIINGDNEVTNPSTTGVILATQDVTVTLANQASAGISGAVSYIRDTNNGTRYSGYPGFDYTADQIYINSTGAGGITSAFNVLLGEVVKPVYTVSSPFDIRGKTNTPGADLFDVYTLAYGYQPLLFGNAKLQSTSTLALSGTMLTDTYVTLTEANAVTKLASSFAVNTSTNTITVTINSSLDDLYDVMKVYKTRAIQAQLEYPTIGTQPVTASGSIASTAMAITVNSGVDLAAGVKLASLTAGTITAALASGGPYTYSGGTLAAPTTAPSLTAGTLSIDGAGTYVFSMSAGIISMTPAAAGTYVMNGCTFSGTIDLRNTTAFPITVKVPNTATIITSNNVGGAITIDSSVAVTISAPNLLSGSRVRLYNVTDGVELYNDVLAIAGLSFGLNWSTNKTIQLTATYSAGTTAKLGVSATGILTSAGLTYLDGQLDDAVYNAIGVDGSLVSGFTADYANEEISLTAGANFNVSDLYAWWVFINTTADGIREFFSGITAEDIGNFRVNTSVVSIYLDNTTTTSIYQLDNRRFYRADGAYPVKTPTSGGGGIDVNWRDQVLLAQSAEIAQIKAMAALIPALF
jgi:hypothetical protein